MKKSQMSLGHSSEFTDTEDDVIDFSNAVLYVGALQTIFATASASMVSVLSCWLLPVHVISAVRTLVLSSIVAVLLVRKPFRLGRVHGLGLIFNALRPCVLIYIVSMVLEQLVHTCTREYASPSWLRIVFHFSIVIAMLSGFARARKPLEQTDVPFLVTSTALFVIAMLPPPAVILSGPLCSEPTFNSSAERLARSLVFSLLYCTFVYASAPPVQSSGEVLVCVMRASAASLWTLGCHVLILPLALVQAMIVIYVRIYSSEYQVILEDEPLITVPVSHVDADDDDDDDDGGGGGCGGDIESRQLHQAAALPIEPQSQRFLPNGVENVINPTFSAFGARNLVDIGTTPNTNACNGAVAGGQKPQQQNGMSKERMAAIAAHMEAAAL